MTGQVTAKRVVVRALSAIPAASFAMVLAVAGAIMAASAFWASSMCFTEVSVSKYRSDKTGFSDNTSKVVMPTNFFALSVIMTVT